MHGHSEHWKAGNMQERQSRVTIVVKATGESSESSTSLSVVKSVQNVIRELVDRLLNSQVIHYTLPESLEKYVQIGSAGLDDRLSYCHLFFDDSTYFKLRSLTYSDGVDEYAVSRFLSEVFTNELDSHGKICSLVKELALRKFDMKEEGSAFASSSVDLGSARQTETRVQRQLSGKKSDIETYRSDINTKHQRTGSSLSGT
ncbi:ATP-dependent DNA helicase Q-like 5 [Camellia lanceoleosa]|uniref:ATP-dependent DNA helicase Q-like 5 n=1 Tax=Camellia lanceoleosa TaxID=1840588 RepID=A0ACC0GI29_9ERIC|nr:ATP-dependent DNA helicase Q-like 5 [Camellia lanceoleosa]